MYVCVGNKKKRKNVCILNHNAVNQPVVTFNGSDDNKTLVMLIENLFYKMTHNKTHLPEIKKREK